MGNGKKPETVGEHIVALYGHITGVKRDIEELREEVQESREEVKESRKESTVMHNKFEQKFDTLTKWIVYGLGSTITILIGIAFHLLNK